jgi:hypothetical protein
MSSEAASPAAALAAFLERPGVKAALKWGTWIHKNHKQSKDKGVTYRTWHLLDPATGETMEVANIPFKNAEFGGIYDKRVKKEVTSLSHMITPQSPIIFQVYPKLAPLVNAMLAELSSTISPAFREKRVPLITNERFNEETGETKKYDNITIFYSIKFPKDNPRPTDKAYAKFSKVVSAGGVSKVEEVPIYRNNVEAMFPSGSTRVLMGKLSANEITTSGMGIHIAMNMRDVVMGPPIMRANRAAEAVAELDEEELAAMLTAEDQPQQQKQEQPKQEEEKNNDSDGALAAAEAQLAALSAN